MFREHSGSWKIITYSDVSIDLKELDVCSQLSPNLDAFVHTKSDSG